MVRMMRVRFERFYRELLLGLGFLGGNSLDEA
jgi:hypothetical protein